MRYLTVLLWLIFCGGVQAQTNLTPGNVGGKTNIAGATTYAIYGDSIISGSDNNSYGLTPCTTLCQTNISGGYGTWLDFYLFKRITRQPNTNNFGVAGETTAQILARIGTVLAAKPDVVVMDGGANDASAGITCGTAVANLRSMFTQFQAAGIAVVYSTIYPRSGGNVYTATQTKVALCINAANRAYASQPGVHGFYLVDLDKTMADPSQTTWTSPTVGGLSVLQDGVHPSPTGGSLMALTIANVMNALVPSWYLPTLTNSDIYDATNNPRGALNTNPTLSGSSGTVTGTGCSGTVATSWILDCSNALGSTAVGSQAAASDGSFEQVVTIGGTSTGSSAVALTSVPTAANFAAGDTIQFCALVSIGANSGIAGIDVELLTIQNGVNNFDYGAAPASTVTVNLPTTGFPASGFVPVCTPQRTLAFAPSTVFAFVNIAGQRNGAAESGTVTIQGAKVAKVLN